MSADCSHVSDLLSMCQSSSCIAVSMTLHMMTVLTNPAGILSLIDLFIFGETWTDGPGTKAQTIILASCRYTAIAVGIHNNYCYIYKAGNTWSILVTAACSLDVEAEIRCCSSKYVFCSRTWKIEVSWLEFPDSTYIEIVGLQVACSFDTVTSSLGCKHYLQGSKTMQRLHF